MSNLCCQGVRLASSVAGHSIERPHYLLVTSWQMMQAASPKLCAEQHTLGRGQAGASKPRRQVLARSRTGTRASSLSSGDRMWPANTSRCRSGGTSGTRARRRAAAVSGSDRKKQAARQRTIVRLMHAPLQLRHCRQRVARQAQLQRRACRGDELHAHAHSLGRGRLLLRRSRRSRARRRRAQAENKKLTSRLGVSGDPEPLRCSLC